MYLSSYFFSIILLVFTEILSGICYNNNSKKEEDRKNKGKILSFMWSDECSDNRCFAYLHQIAF